MVNQEIICSSSFLKGKFPLPVVRFIYSITDLICSSSTLYFEFVPDYPIIVTLKLSSLNSMIVYFWYSFNFSCRRKISTLSCGLNTFDEHENFSTPTIATKWIPRTMWFTYVCEWQVKVQSFMFYWFFTSSTS